ncbi:MAG: ADP-ribose diphosphatase, partial [Gammaproteobacteria bacterium]|nr:ADP-ribose diphosphatase [Gammaproteobacteria bacterium]
MKWEIIDRALGYQGFFRLDVFRIRHALFNGGWSPTLTRELFRRSDGVAVLPYDPVRDRVLLIEQFRMGAIESPQGPWLTEIIAGSIEPGEDRETV